MKRMASRSTLQRAIPAASLLFIALAIRKYGHYNAAKAMQQARGNDRSEKSIHTSKDTQKKTLCKHSFYQQFKRLFPIIIPRINCPEVFTAVSLALFLAIRSYFDILTLQVAIAIKRSIISRSRADTQHNMRRFAILMVPLSAVNSLLRYGQTDLMLRIRSRLTRFLYDQYLTQYTFYKATNLDTRLKNVDHVITSDVERFADSFADLYVNIAKPVMDIMLLSYTLISNIGIQAPAIITFYLVSSGAFLSYIRQPSGTFTNAQQHMEGNFRSIQSRLSTHAEEIAFYNGQHREKTIVNETIAKLMQMTRNVHLFRLGLTFIDNIVVKYSASLLGFCAISVPYFNTTHAILGRATYEQRMESLNRTEKMFLNLSDAVGRIVLSGHELTRLMGLTARVTELMDVLADVKGGKYQLAIAEEENVPAHGLFPNKGRIAYQDSVIAFENVPLVTPNGDILVHSLHFQVHSGMNVIVTGPNGCGKSSLFRILGELWPLFGGIMTKPSRHQLFYIPQRPYLTLGNLRDQIIYPHSELERNCTDEELTLLMDTVHLTYLISREGWDAVRDWTDVLSGGEKQRVAMARLFYHKPQFAILDECTSAVSMDVEGAMYTHCRNQNITLFTVSHRKSLYKYHDFMLKFDGHGKYEFRKMAIEEETEVTKSIIPHDDMNTELICNRANSVRTPFLMLCAISNQIPTEPVISIKSGYVFEKRLILKYLEQNQNICPITGEELTFPQDLLPIQSVPIKHDHHSPSSASILTNEMLNTCSIPNLLQTFQNEWDAVMLETFTLRQHLDKTRQELSHALYQYDAACRVIARLNTENALLSTKLESAGKASEDVDMDKAQTLSPEKITKIEEKQKSLAKERKNFKKLIAPEKAKKLQSIATHFQPIEKLSLHESDKSGVLCIAIDPKRPSLFATGAMDKQIQLYDLHSHQIQSTFKGHQKRISHVQFHATAPLLLSSSHDKSIKLWSTVDSDQSKCLSTFSEAQDAVTMLSIHATGAYFISSANDGAWRLYDLHHTQLLHESYFSESNQAQCIQFHPDGGIFAMGTDQIGLQMYDLKTCKHLMSFEQHQSPIQSLSFSENGYHLFSAASNGSIHLWDLRKLKSIFTITASTIIPDTSLGTQRITFDPSGTYAALAIGMHVSILHETGKSDWSVVKTFSDSKSLITDIQFSHDSEYFACTSMDRFVRIYKHVCA